MQVSVACINIPSRFQISSRESTKSGAQPYIEGGGREDFGCQPCLSVRHQSLHDDSEANLPETRRTPCVPRRNFPHVFNPGCFLLGDKQLIIQIPNRPRKAQICDDYENCGATSPSFDVVPPNFRFAAGLRNLLFESKDGPFSKLAASQTMYS